jgi:phage terminase large subunit
VADVVVQANDIVIDGGLKARHYQLPYMRAMDSGCPFAVWVMHRRGGKDRTALAQACKQAFRRVGLYWHCLPTQRQGRKVVWDNITSEGTNLITQTFPQRLVKRKIEDEMKIELVNGSIVQIVGADTFNANIGASPVHVTFSEWSVTDPRAYDYVRPILRENKGSVSFIFTPRGYNHGWQILNIAKKLPGAFWAVMGIRDTGVLTDEDMALERLMDMPEELIQQEYYVDFASANVGAIVGRYISAMEREGRLVNEGVSSHDARVIVSCDLGYRDAAAFWWWECRHGGWHIFDYEEGTQMDAQQWIARIKAKPHPLTELWLPHDAKAKTFQSSHSVIEQFTHAFPGLCHVVPQAKISDRINAARSVLPHCTMNSGACGRGLEVLRAWSFRYDDERKEFSVEPDHNWASHGGDAFSYGAQVVKELARPAPSQRDAIAAASTDGLSYPFTLGDLWRARQQQHLIG